MTATPELIRIPAPYLQQERRYTTSEMRKYKYAYETPDGRWLIEYAYGECGGGWRVTDTHGEHVCTSCRHPDGHATIEPTLTAAKAFVSEWSVSARDETITWLAHIIRKDTP